MNIFFLDSSPEIAASYHCDKHVVKMILEYAQLLSTAHRMLDGEHRTFMVDGKKKKSWVHPDPFLDAELYRVTHMNHPSAVWVRESPFHYLWVYQCMMALNEEYKSRYNHTEDHATIQKLGKILSTAPKALSLMSEAPITLPPQCVADDCKTDDTVEAYRLYYNRHKAGIARWKVGNIPRWFAPSVTDHATRQTMYGMNPETLDTADEWLRLNDPDYAT